MWHFLQFVQELRGQACEERTEGSGSQMGLAVVGEEVMVCVMDNRGTIMVYNKELNYVRHFEHRDMGYFWAISR